MEPVINRMVAAAQDLLSGTFRTEKRRVTFLERDANGMPLNNKMVEIVTRPNFVEIGPPKVIECVIYSDEDQIRNKLLNRDEKELKSNPPKHVTRSVMRSLIRKCNQLIEDQKKINEQKNVSRLRSAEGRSVDGESGDSRHVEGRNSNMRRSNSRSSVAGHGHMHHKHHPKAGMMTPSVISSSVITSDDNSTRANVTESILGVTDGSADYDSNDGNKVTTSTSVGIFNGLAIYPGTKW